MLLTSSSIISVLGLISSLTFLCISAYYFVSSAEKTARLFSISPFMIGLSVVALGTSLPEVIVVVFASFDKNSDLIIGNIIGSNIANTALVLALSLVYFGSKISMNKQDIKLLVLMVAVTFLFATMSYLQSELIASSGLLLLGCSIPFIYLLTALEPHTEFTDSVNTAPNSSSDAHTQGKPAWRKNIPTVLILLSSLGVLLLSAEFTVHFAVDIAHLFNLSPTLIGLSLIALGTSSPEIITGIMAMILRQPLIGISAVIGSNFLNIALGLGIGATINDITINTVTYYRDLPYLLGFTTAFLLLLIQKNYVYKIVGTAMIIGYIAYIYTIYITEFA